MTSSPFYESNLCKQSCHKPTMMVRSSQDQAQPFATLPISATPVPLVVVVDWNQIVLVLVWCAVRFFGLGFSVLCLFLPWWRWQLTMTIHCHLTMFAVQVIHHYEHGVVSLVSLSRWQQQEIVWVLQNLKIVTVEVSFSRHFMCFYFAWWLATQLRNNETRWWKWQQV